MNSFYKIYEFAKIFGNQKKLNEELKIIKDENSLNLLKKDHDLKIFNKRHEELTTEINSLKNKENEMEGKIKTQDLIINSLQIDTNIDKSNDLTIQNSKKNIPINEGNNKVKALEQKVEI